ncbi:MAG: XdhC family protein [Desulfobacterales bacterium]|nr:XdhC family protein [Desulfobacterales bacterium]
MNNFFLDLDKLLISGQKVVVARIIFQKGSAPRSIGTKCIILENGEILGTIGGGALEYQVIEKAQSVFKTGKSATIHFQLTGEDVAETDMLCGGIVDVFLEPMFPDNQVVRDVFGRTRDLVITGKAKGKLLTLIADGISRDRPDRHALMIKDGSGVQVIGRIPGGLDVGTEKLFAGNTPELKRFPIEGVSIFMEPIQSADVLYIFGAGHISTFLSPLAKRVGFGVVVIDDRGEFANAKRFPDADEIMVVPLSQSFDRISVTPSSYIAIITRGHIHDHAVLKEALKHEPAYIGMIGSKRKREVIYQALIKEGASKATLQQVHSPIGLAIGAETPEEIAVSIVAELIQERERSRKRPAG